MERVGGMVEKIHRIGLTLIIHNIHIRATIIVPIKQLHSHDRALGLIINSREGREGGTLDVCVLFHFVV